MVFDYKFTSHWFKSPGYLMCDVPECVKEELLQTIDDINSGKIEVTDQRKILAGHLEKETSLPITENIKYLVESMSVEYDNIFLDGKSEIRSIMCNEQNNRKFNYTLESLWINYAKKYDFNPIHTHSGSYSFVIWVNIPYKLDQELSLYDPNDNNTSLFSFQYITTLGDIASKKIYIDKNYEWKMAFFPAKLNHCVYPFYTSDEYRISIAGNVFAKFE